MTRRRRNSLFDFVNDFAGQCMQGSRLSWRSRLIVSSHSERLRPEVSLRTLCCASSWLQEAVDTARTSTAIEQERLSDNNSASVGEKCKRLEGRALPEQEHILPSRIL